VNGDEPSGSNCHVFSRKSLPCVHKRILQINKVSRSKTLWFSTSQLRKPTSVTSCLCRTLWLGDELNRWLKQRNGEKNKALCLYSLSVRLSVSLCPNLAPKKLDSSFCERLLVLSTLILTVQFLWHLALRRESSPLALLDLGLPLEVRQLFIFRYHHKRVDV